MEQPHQQSFNSERDDPTLERTDGLFRLERKLLDYVRRHLELHKVHAESNDREREIFKERDEKILKYNRFVSLLLTHIIHVLCAIIPFVAVLISLFKSYMKGENFTNLPFIMHLYFPSVFDRSMAFQLVYQTSLYVWWSCMLYCWSVLARSVYFCFACLAAEIDLFCVSLEEISENESEEKLRKRMGKLVHEHQLICRNTEYFGRVSSKIIFGIVNLYGSQICIYLIFITLIDDIYVKVRYIICYAVVFAFIYFISWNGQIITDLGRRLKLTLFQSSWIDKPVWFRKTLLFMMTRASKDILIRPFGLYILGIDCIVTVCKGTYTYMNFANEMLR
ncbi:uncharacterized protein LOC120353683 [Nilaparvata lugens]|uniref:uncharacterized protein LOC120353683 n=1 Tax=Nilaparvata lugens TaxID=108931 RepID=UPI00193DF99C|nr:uncharacterized protein LOC120353683 [Nilaparvata lugens]